MKIERRTGAVLLDPTTMLPKWDYKKSVFHFSLNYKVQVKLNTRTKILLLEKNTYSSQIRLKNIALKKVVPHCALNYKVQVKLNLDKTLIRVKLGLK